MPRNILDVRGETDALDEILESCREALVMAIVFVLVMAPLVYLLFR